MAAHDETLPMAEYAVRELGGYGLSHLLMMGATTHITTDIASVPLLWVVPLAVYLLSFVLVFARRPLLPHALAVRALPLLVLPLTILALCSGPIAASAPAKSVVPET